MEKTAKELKDKAVTVTKDVVEKLQERKAAKQEAKQQEA